MSWFSKKKDDEKLEVPPRLPDLPELPDSSNKFFLEGNENQEPEMPELPELPEIEISPLPTLPSSQNQDQIMQAINPRIDNQKMQISRFAPLPQPKEYEPLQMTKSEALASIRLKTKLLPLKTKPNQEQSTDISSKKEPIYVRLDKFESAIQSFEEIKNKIIDIERLLIKTEEIRAEEVKELEEWERELQTLKSRLDSIDKTIFKELD